MRLLLHDTLATAPFIIPLGEGWVTPASDVVVEIRADLRGADLDAYDVALFPVAEVAACQETHRVVPDVACVAGSVGPVVMRTPVRPDEVERSPVRLLATSGAGEVLARATLRPYYGIEPTAWVSTADDPMASSAQVVVVEGVEALRPPEAGFAEDLSRAWFVLTGTAAVTHVLVAPLAADRAVLRPVLETFAALRQAGHDRRREWRRSLAAAQDLPLDRVHAFFAEQRLALDGDDRRALLMLLQRGGRGSAYPPVATVQFLEPELAAG